MEFWNDLDTVKLLRTIALSILAISSFFSVILFDRTNKLSAQKYAKDKLESEINLKLIKADNAFALMKGDDLEGMNELIKIYHNSPHEKVKKEIRKLLDKADVFFKKDKVFSKLTEPQWEALAKMDKNDFHFYKRLMGKTRTVHERASILCQLNGLFGLDFKIYEIDAINKWFNDDEHIKMITEAKKRIVNK